MDGGFFLAQLWPLASSREILLLIMGGIAYSAGAGIYAIKRPNPLPVVFGFHEIFHVLILLGCRTALPGYLFHSAINQLWFVCSLPLALK
jgi:channel protein (hemolysin III family)